MRVKHSMPEADEFDRLPEFGAPETPVFDLGALWRILAARVNVMLVTAAVVLAIATAAWLFITPLFSASAVLMLDQRKNAVADGNAVLGGLPTDPTSIQNQVQILTSRKLAATVVQKLNLDRDGEFGTAGAAPSAPGTPAFEQTIDRVLKRLKVEPAGLSTSIAVSVGSVKAERSAELTNAWVDAYIDDQLTTKFEATQKAGEWFAIRARQLATQVQADEVEVQTYKAKHGIVNTAGVGGSLIDQQTASVSTQLITAKAELAQKQAAHNRIVQLQRAGRAADASEVAGSPLIVQLRAQQAELERQAATLSERYLAKHPKLIDIRAQAADTRARIAIEVRRIVEGLANDVAVAQANIASLDASLGALQTKFRDEGSAGAKLKALEATAAASRSLYEAILSRMKEVQGQEGIATPDARVVSRAVAPLQASPRFASIFGIALPVAIALALFLAFMAEGLDATFRTSQQVSKFLGAPAVASVPAIKDSAFALTDLTVREPNGAFAESIRGLYLAVTSVEAVPRTVLVTSATPGEGKTVVAVNLARLAARSGRRVALVDADFRKPSVATAIGIKPTAGVLQALRNDPVERCASTDPQSSVAVFACTERPENPAELAGSSAMEKLLSDLRGRYDLVIVDSAPLSPVHDSWSLSRIADATLLTVQAGRTPRDAVAGAIRTLRAMRATIAGVALNRAEGSERHSDYLVPTQPKSVHT